jgi:hypothetical protein
MMLSFLMLHDHDDQHVTGREREGERRRQPRAGSHCVALVRSLMRLVRVRHVEGRLSPTLDPDHCRIIQGAVAMS